MKRKVGFDLSGAYTTGSTSVLPEGVRTGHESGCFYPGEIRFKPVQGPRGKYKTGTRSTTIVLPTRKRKR